MHNFLQSITGSYSKVIKSLQTCCAVSRKETQAQSTCCSKTIPRGWGGPGALLGVGGPGMSPAQYLQNAP